MNSNDKNNHQTMCFPFDFVPINNQKCPFIQNVERILATDLQAKDSFGCMIKQCHTHAGSKIHFQDFVEAEILFHNNYYNHGFAYLTASEILSHIEMAQYRYKHIYLVGYESYSELFLKEVIRQLSQAAKNSDGNPVTCDYFIYETISASDTTWKETEASVRNLFVNEKNEYNCCYGLQLKNRAAKHHVIRKHSDSLFVYIVPINTTLSTLDKMISKFEQECGLSDSKAVIEKEFFCLITIGPRGSADKNLYWKKKATDYTSGDTLIPQKGKFLNLTEKNEIRSFAYVESTWTYAKVIPGEEGSSEKNICKTCYPDIADDTKTLLEETPIFDVTRGSVVPMLQLGQRSQLEPINLNDACVYDSNMINLKRIWAVSAYTSHHHISRGNNHFQFYIDAPGFISEYGNPIEDEKSDLSIEKFLLGIRNRQKSQDVDEGKAPKKKVIYNYIVAPSHRTNAAWVDLVYSTVFSNDFAAFNEEFNGARVLYFDIIKEYRSNFKAKYSDFFQSFSNIIHRDQDYEIRFHYVDETIASGSRFLRAADLVQSLLSSIPLEKKKLERIKLFHSVYLLYGRSSTDSKKFYYRLFKEACINDIDSLMKENFHEYVSIRISQMRNYKDSCVLCKMADDYRAIRRHCATNLMADGCGEIIRLHRPEKAHKLASEGLFYCPDGNMEKRYLFLISHILNTRLCSGNTPMFIKRGGEKYRRQIDVESETAPEEIKEVLQDYYDNLIRWLNGIPKLKAKANSEAFKTAFIKAISRPFFTFHLRKRQASFAFCLELLDQHLRKDKEYNKLIQTLIKALSDMNANYLIRQEPFLRIKSIVENSGVLAARQYCQAVKKMLALSQDTTKSLLLEHILVNSREDGFFGEASTADNAGGLERFIQDGKYLSLQGLLYVENNRIVNDALRDIYRSPSLCSMENMPYFLDNMKSLLDINRIELSAEFGNHYKKLVDGIKNDKELSFYELNESLKNISPKGGLGEYDSDLWVMPFVRIKSVSEDGNNFNKLFEFVSFTTGESSSDTQKFYHDNSFREIRKMFRDIFDDESDVAICKDVVFASNGNVCIRFNGFSSEVNTDSDGHERHYDNSLYMQLKNFDRENLAHWFRLKVLLSLHALVADLIAKVNMPVATERKFSELLQKAISTKKSGFHSDLEKTMNVQFLPDRPSEFGISKIIKAIRANHHDDNDASSDALEVAVSRVYCQYYSRLADELLASWYRRIIRKEKGSIEKLPHERNLYQQAFFHADGNDDTVEDYFKNLFNADFDEKPSKENNAYNVGSFVYRIHDVNERFIDMKVSIRICCSDDITKKPTNFEVFSFAIEGSRIARSALYPIIALLIQNAAVHGGGQKVDIYFDVQTKSIRIENDVKRTALDENHDEYNLDEFVSILPTLRTKAGPEKSMTLWTLKHLIKKHDWITAKRDSNKFTVVISNWIGPMYY